MTSRTGTTRATTARATTVRATTVRAALVWASGTVAAGLGVGWLRPDLAVSGGPPASLDEALAQGAALVGSACLGWLWLVTGLTVLEAVDLGTHARLGCPTGLRRLVLAACGVALAGGLAGPAQATDPGDSAARDRGAHVVAGLALPERTTGVTAPVRPVQATAQATAEATAAAREVQEPVVVAPGDSLWSVAARLLPATASDVEVAALWRRIYAANRVLIGEDPGLIRPGQRLVVPEAVR